MSHHHLYDCICGDQWDHPRHKARMSRDLRVNQWKGHPGQIVPHRQWTRENLPPTSARFVVAGDDGFARRWTADDPLGCVAPIEWKTFGATLDNPTSKIFAILGDQHQRIRSPLIVRLIGGNTPGPLRHYPTTDECDLPEPLVVATAIMLNGSPVSCDELVARIVGHIQPEAA